MKLLRKLFGKSAAETPSSPPTEAGGDSGEAWKQHHEYVGARMEAVLGPEHDMVMHAIFPYAAGGALDIYFYPNGIPGTGIATKEISSGEAHPPSSNALFERYEMVMFTRHAMDSENARNPDHPWGHMFMRMQRVLNHLAPYSSQATLNPGNTLKFPADMPMVGGACFAIFPYGPELNEPQPFGLMVPMELHPAEMAFAREFGAGQLYECLKAAGVFPYSDMDRASVV
jgi:hypothetical protein